MKKNVVLRVILVFFLVVIVVILSFVTLYLVLTGGTRLDERKFKSTERGAVYYDTFGEILSEEDSGSEIVCSDDIPSYVKKAFVAIEDKRFYEHRGIDIKGLFRATLNNIKSFSLREGASTITQQLIKNTHLSGEKTLSRKLKEIKLAVSLEKKYEKNKILETYLNTIYFGEGCYGIKAASERYFAKKPSELTINEGAILAAIIKAPSVYSPFCDMEKCRTRKNIVLSEMKKQGYIGDKDFLSCINEMPEFNAKSQKSYYGFLHVVKRELSDFLDKNAYRNEKINVYTTLDPTIQSAVESAIKNDETKTDKSVAIFDKENNVIAYYSTCGELRRQVGSVIKPLVVYAPAYERGIIQPLSPVLDEKINIGGYSPDNYNDKYYGYISAKESLAKSLNSCAVKILNYTGVGNAVNYLKKTDFPITDNDNSLCVALGCTDVGATLCEAASAYGIFINGGDYKHFSSINRVETKSGDLLYKSNKKTTKVFEKGTCDLVNDSLSECVKNGTAKKLSFLYIPVYSKTGTVGTENGNTDAYNISYTENYVLGIWCGNRDKSFMDNSITGGTIPSKKAAEIWKKIYSEKQSPDKLPLSDEVQYEKIDRLSYEEEHVLVGADPASSEKDILNGLFIKKYLPKTYSTRYSSPKFEKTELSVNNGIINIRLCLTKYCGAIIYREENGKKSVVKKFFAGDGDVSFSDGKISESQTYSYYAVPFYDNGKTVFFGEEILLGKIKTPPKGGEKDWWHDDLQ